MQALWKDQLIAESADTIQVEGNHYFPVDSVHQAFLKPSQTTTHCHWKGTAHYYHVEIDGQRLEDAAWYYPEPLAEAQHIRGYLAFWKGVRVVP